MTRKENKIEESFNNSGWSVADKNHFYFCLHQRNDAEKAHILNQKATHLLAAKRKHSLKGVIELTSEAITGYPDKEQICKSYLLRAKAYEMLKNLKAAELDYIEAYNWFGITDKDKMEMACQYIEFILRHNRKKDYDKALEMVDLIESDIFRLIVHEFVMLAAKAIIMRRRGKRLYRTANEALKLVQIRKYKNSEDKTGLVDLERYAFMIDELLKIAN